MSDTAESPGRPTAAERIAAQRAAKAAEKAARRGTATIPGRAGSLWSRLVASVELHRRVLVLTGIALGALGAAGAGLAVFIEGRAHASGDGLWSGAEALGARIVAEGDTPPEDAIGESFASPKARAEAALARFRSAQPSAGKAAAAWLALGEAHALHELGKHDEARKAFARAQELGQADPFVVARAIEGLAVSFEAQENVEQAMRHFETLSAHDDGRYRLVGDYHRARFLSAQGKRKEALELLDGVLVANEAAKPEDAERFASVREAAQTLRDEIAVELGAPRLRADLPGGVTTVGQTSEATRQIIEALQKQLGESKAAEAPGK